VGELDGLGRHGPGFVLVAGGLGGLDRRSLLDLLGRLPSRTAPLPVVLLGTTDDPSPLPAGGCRRAALLDVVGEPVALPCGRCDVCLGVPGDPVALLTQRAIDN
jgi:hypothetical protein